MFFIGYHGTSEASAVSILTEGVQRDKLPETGQIGPGFYIAKTNGTLPQWGADWATDGARRRLNAFQRIVSALTGEANNPFIGNDAVRTILKIYSTRPLRHTKWGVMNPQNLNMIKAVIEDEVGRLQVTRSAAMQTMLNEWSRWLQMVVPPDELPYLVARRDNQLDELPHFWHPRESPY